MTQTGDSSIDLVVGNAAIDAYLIGASTSFEGSRVLIMDGSTEVEIECNEPIRKGGKHVANAPFFMAIQPFRRREVFGGGGLNSLRELAACDLQSPHYYLDVSTPSLDTDVPGKNLRDELLERYITPTFLSARPIPLNLVLGDRSDKVIVKSPVKTSTLQESDLHIVQDFLQRYQFQRILMNSVKDQKIAEIVVTQPWVMAVVTTSLDPGFVKSRIVPSCCTQFNYDELGYVMEHPIEGDENTNLEAAIQDIDRLRMDFHPRYPIFVTLGRNGVLMADENKTYHIKLDPELSPRLQEHIASNPTRVCGAGDAFAAHAFLAMKRGASPVEAAINACLQAIKYMGYSRVRPSEFVTREFGTEGYSHKHGQELEKRFN